MKKQLKKAEGKLHDAEKQVEEGQDALDSAKRGMADGIAGAAGDVVDKVRDELRKVYKVINDTDFRDIAGGIVTDPEGTLEELQKNLDELKASLSKLMDDLESGRLRTQVEGTVSNMMVNLMDGMIQITEAQIQLDQAKTQIESGLKQIREAYKNVSEQTDLGGLLSISTVSGLLTACMQHCP